MSFKLRHEKQFCIGFHFHIAHGLFLSIGWLTFEITKHANTLDGLPSMDMSPCKGCGNSDWKSCNPHPDGGFHECDKCRGIDGGPHND